MSDIITLVGGLEHFLFSHILGIIIPIGFHIFQRALFSHHRVPINSILLADRLSMLDLSAEVMN